MHHHIKYHSRAFENVWHGVRVCTSRTRGTGEAYLFVLNAIALTRPKFMVSFREETFSVFNV